MKVNIRKASAEDYDSLFILFDEVDALHRNNLPGRVQKPHPNCFVVKSMDLINPTRP